MAVQQLFQERGAAARVAGEQRDLSPFAGRSGVAPALEMLRRNLLEQLRVFLGHVLPFRPELLGQGAQQFLGGLKSSHGGVKISLTIVQLADLVPGIGTHLPRGAATLGQLPQIAKRCFNLTLSYLEERTLETNVFPIGRQIAGPARSSPALPTGDAGARRAPSAP